MKPIVTLKELARELGVSISTVSKALSQHPSIGHRTRERVVRLAEARHYIPNAVARNFQRGRSLTIGLMVPNVLDQFFVQAVNGVDTVATEQQYSVLISQTLDDETRANSILNMMLRDGVDGVIATITPGTTDLSAYQRLEASGIPVVYMARSPNDASCAQVTVLNTDTARQATELLVSRGHRRLAYLNGPANVAASHQRQAGFEQALQDQPMVVGRIVQPDSLNPVATEQAMQHLMQQPDYPTGILAFKTYMALDAINYLKRHYPTRLDEIEFVSFGNLPMLKHLTHRPIATIEENPKQMGQTAMQLLLQLINDEPITEKQIAVPGELVVC